MREREGLVLKCRVYKKVLLKRKEGKTLNCVEGLVP
jgi:hypothetical protein